MGIADSGKPSARQIVELLLRTYLPVADTKPVCVRLWLQFEAQMTMEAGQKPSLHSGMRPNKMVLSRRLPLRRAVGGDQTYLPNRGL